MDARMHGCMDAWMHGWMEGRMDGERERDVYIYIYKMHLARVLAFCHTVSNAVMPIGTACMPQVSCPFLFPSPSMLTFIDHMLIGLCPYLLLSAMFHLQKHIY